MDRVIRHFHDFNFVDFCYDQESTKLSLIYRFDDDDEIIETWEFLGAKTKLDNSENKALQKCFQALHIACGVSYFKAFTPPNIKFLNKQPSQSWANFFQNFYQKGLSEFSYRNRINLSKLEFPYSDQQVSLEGNRPVSGLLSDQIVVPIGGGKDSAATLGLLAQSGLKFKAIKVGNALPIVNMIKAAGIESFTIQRTISPKIFEYNKAGAYNGHVPITGILSFVFLAASILYGYRVVVMSNEKSANQGNNVKTGNIEVNHQWSKSFEFEKSFQSFVRNHIFSDFEYFSLLRPLSEYNIAKIFARHKIFHDVFTSCNQIFKLQNPEKNWCGSCPKCQFVFLILAPFMKQEHLIKIFGSNLLDKKDFIRDYRALTGIESHKPFECVGEVEECQLAILTLYEKEEWKNCIIIQELTPHILLKANRKSLYSHVTKMNDIHQIPQYILERISENL